MVKMGKKICMLLVSWLFTISLYSQENKQLQNTFLEAEYFFMNEDYSDAINYYLQI
jgi:hypothetical protein